MNIAELISRDKNFDETEDMGITIRTADAWLWETFLEEIPRESDNDDDAAVECDAWIDSLNDDDATVQRLIDFLGLEID